MKTQGRGEVYNFHISSSPHLHISTSPHQHISTSPHHQMIPPHPIIVFYHFFVFLYL